MKIYLVRHGQCDSNVMMRFNRFNEDINETGVKQAEKLREKIKSIDYDIIISSPLVRAVHTAEIINAKNKKIIIDDRLVERKSRSLEGTPLSDELVEEYWYYYSNVKIGNEERIPELCKRVNEFLDELKTKEYKVF